ncbi:site-specific integrase [Saccharopolyspora sp. K220]|uniref:tyrosine-type recombinase/integrase n=1 Tax=Saccharopolyspora soli TaxID=2926618 RepID=UPI001F5A03FD|nr:site-specific integrase [Saccharopolyspora soli]MCI2416298.1 site-specific integrase [Saccharopolyspora soli]
MPVDDLWYLRGRDPGTGERIPSKRHGRGKRWRVRWVDPKTGQTQTALFGKRAQAERHDANVHADISRGLYIDPNAGKITVTEYSERWRNDQLHRDSTVVLVERAFRIHINPILGHWPLGDLQPSHIRSWVKDRTTVLAPSTVHLFYGYIAAMCRAAVHDKLIGSTPCVNIRLPDIEREDYFVPKPEQVHTLAEELFERYRAVPYVAAGCGARPSENFGLEVEHLDFEHREITIVQQLKQLPGQPPQLAKLKTKTSRRTVEMPEVTADALKRHLEAYPPKVVMIDDVTDPRNPVRRPARLVFTTTTGLPVTRSNWSPVWRSAVKRAKLPAGFGLHGLRHYFATLLIHAGASVKTVQLALGHSTPTITLNTYAHEWPDAVDRTRALVDAALGVMPKLA